jgi:hypothetical protein
LVRTQATAGFFRSGGADRNKVIETDAKRSTQLIAKIFGRPRTVVRTGPAAER